jgi:hypothetical protein
MTVTERTVLWVWRQGWQGLHLSTASLRDCCGNQGWASWQCWEVGMQEGGPLSSLHQGTGGGTAWVFRCLF